MARAIDGDKLVEDLRLIATCWSVSSFVSKEKHNGAIDMLKEVEREVKELPTLTPPNEWVSVEERLPQLRENVLVCAYWHEHWGVYIGWNNGHGWTVSCGIGQRNDVQVSHWMLLPAPPARRPTEGDA